MIEYVIAAVVGLAVGALAMRLVGGGASDATLAQVRAEAEAEVKAARVAAEQAVEKAAKAQVAEAEAEAKARSEALAAREGRLARREEAFEAQQEDLKSREGKLSKREKDLGRRERRIEKQEESAQEALTEARTRLEEAAALSPDEARSLLMDEVRQEARQKAIDDIRTIEQEAAAVAEEKARTIVCAAIQRYASEHVADRTITSVSLASDDMKGRIIGREGRNIRAFESATGCDLIIDDTPETVILSAFNPVRREVGRLALEQLLADGRIHPARIEEVVRRTAKDVEGSLRQYGEAAALELEITGLHPELLKALGRLQFVSTFGQNALRHSIEVGFLAGAMASELGLNPKNARRAGLLHDIGRGVTHETPGDHAEAGAALLRKHGEQKNIVDAVAAHHDPKNQTTMLAQLVDAANTLSASRPGARREQLASYVKRLEDLEALCQEFEGVDRCFALQSGAQLKVMVDNARLSDRDADLLARDIAHRIETEQAHPGDVTVSVVRITRAVQYAR
ncbi:MAG: ribonuclease Y [Myxococcales bacterium]|nr:ribonuclease Y [Myxococcales bacterium]